MQTIIILSETALLVGLLWFSTGQSYPPVINENQVSQGALTDDCLVVEVPVNNKAINTSEILETDLIKISDDESLIRDKNQQIEQAYGEGNASLLAGQFTENAEYINENGTVSQGRKAILSSLEDFFTNNPDCELKIKIDTIRFISPGVAIEDGNTMLKISSDAAEIKSRYTTIYVKVANDWLAASIRDHAPENTKEHQSHLEQLSWLDGDWVHEGDDSIINFSCKAVDNGNFLLRTYSILVEGQETATGTERIGWDPQTGRMRVWLFDSEGAYGEGTWHQDGASWTLKLSGVTPEGQTASSTSIYTCVNDHEMVWQSIDGEIAGVKQPDSETFLLVRQAPVPSIEQAVDTK